MDWKKLVLLVRALNKLFNSDIFNCIIGHNVKSISTFYIIGLDIYDYYTELFEKRYPDFQKIVIALNG